MARFFSIEDRDAKLKAVEAELRRQMGETREDLRSKDVRRALRSVHPQMVMRLVRKFARIGETEHHDDPSQIIPPGDMRAGDDREDPDTRRAVRRERAEGNAVQAAKELMAHEVARHVAGKGGDPESAAVHQKMRALLKYLAEQHGFRRQTSRPAMPLDYLEIVGVQRGMEHEDRKEFLRAVEENIQYWDPPPRSVIPRDCLPDVPEIRAAFRRRFWMYATSDGSYWYAREAPNKQISRERFDPHHPWMISEPGGHEASEDDVPVGRADTSDEIVELRPEPDDDDPS